MEASAYLLGVLSLAFSLGLVHALDADHIMAVTALSGRRPGIKQSVRYCSRWAMGHGLVLMFICSLVFGLDWGIPVELSELAEHMIGLVLIMLGLWVLWDIQRRRIHLHFHRHDNRVTHAHWHESSEHQTPVGQHEHRHSATLVGVLHGTAGSAPLLALLPVSKFVTPWVGMAYVFVFSLGVFITMLLFGGLLGRVFTFTASRSRQMINILRGFIAGASIFYGSYLFSGAVL